MPQTPTATDDWILKVEDLATHFPTDDGLVKAVDGVDLTVRPGETHCILGESGCGKSITARSVLQIVDRPGRIVGGRIRYRDRLGGEVEITSLRPDSRAMRSIRGQEISMIFQEPMASLGPVHKVGHQVAETIRLHRPVTKAEAKSETIAMFDRVGIPRAAETFEAYPFELSGGMRQRVMIAMALCCRPRLLIADEPTTALDVTTQAQILDLIVELQDEFGMAVLFITHDLGVVAEIADHVSVMYVGKVVESADVHQLFAAPKHPYTRALLASVPRVGMTRAERLPAIRGMVPHPLSRAPGCAFAPRCDARIDGVCNRREPRLVAKDGGVVACVLHESEENV